jgi:uncharacterized repeat protein (TIGR01451 family)
MKINKTLAALIAGASLGMSGQAFATAAGTLSGITIANQVTLDFNVGGLSQDTKNASVDFLVDNKVDFTVIQQQSITQAIIPNGPSSGATYSVKFTVSNTGNTSQDYSLSAADAGAVTVSVANLANNSPVSDNSDTGVTYKIYVDDGTDTANYNSADDTLTNIDALAAGADAVVWVVIDETSLVDSTLIDGNIAAVGLTVTTYDDNSTAGLGSLTTSDSSNAFDKDSVQVVFADTHASIGTDYDGIQIDYAAFELATADLEITKVMTITADGVSTSNFKAIPGATVKYTIQVENKGSVAAGLVQIQDDLTAILTLDTSLIDNISDLTITGGGNAVSTSAMVVSSIDVTFTSLAADDSTDGSGPDFVQIEFNAVIK